MTVTFLHGDCLAILPTLEACSIDACVTDPPYELGFMGKRWDSTGIANNVGMWREVFRVLKPGAHLLAFSGTRTYHRMVCAIEDAGFEVRDQIGWVYGQGFPKSLDVSKAIDKARTEDAEPVRAVCRAVRSAMDDCGLKSRDLTGHFGNCHPRLIDHWAARDTDSQPLLPTWDQWLVLKVVLKIGDGMDADVWRLNGRKGKPGDIWQAAEVIGEYQGKTPGFGEHRFAVRDTLIREQSETARQWQGWGTALKPAWEPICVARKPLIGTVAANVLAHGTGALNIDGCRVQGVPEPTRFDPSRHNHEGWRMNNTGAESADRASGVSGRWPANIAHDGSDEVLACFPHAPGQMARARTDGLDQGNNTYGALKHITSAPEPRGDAGTAARFFYCAKASKADRAGSKHPTVKPVSLMRWLVRMVTPPGGVVLDPFAGSGTTGAACDAEGFRAVLIEREKEYVADIRRRLAEARGPLFQADTP